MANEYLITFKNETIVYLLVYINKQIKLNYKGEELQERKKREKKHPLQGIPKLSAIVATLLLGSMVSVVDAATFTCDGTPYTVIGNPSKFQTVNRSDLTTSDLGTVNPKVMVNGIGYNILDNYIYAIVNDRKNDKTLKNKDIVQIDKDLNVKMVARFDPADFQPVNANGTMDNDGNYYLLGKTKYYYIIPIGANPSDGSITTYEKKEYNWITNKKWKEAPYDIAFRNVKGKLILYGVSSKTLYSVDVETGDVNTVATTGDQLPPNAGGAWSTADGTLYFYDNTANGKLYRVTFNGDTPKVEFVHKVPQNSYFDATACVPPAINKSAEPKSVDPGDPVTYTFKISNPSQLPMTMSFEDILPDDLKYDTSSRTHLIDSNEKDLESEISVDAFDDKQLKISNIKVPGGGYVTFKVTVNVAENIAAEEDIDNQAAIIYGDNLRKTSDDPTTVDIDDNTTIHVAYVPHPSIAIEKVGILNDGGDGVQAGDTITYTFKVTNTGNVDLSDVTVTDPLVTVSGGPISLKVGESDTTTFTATYTLSDDDIVAGQVKNQATVTGKDPDGNSVTDKSDDPNDMTDVDPDSDGNPDDPTIVKFTAATKAPVAVDDTKEGVLGEPTTLKTLSNDTDEDNDIDPKTVSITTAGATDEDGDGDNDKLVVAGEGVWSVDNTTGDITFTPEAGFKGNPTPIKYKVKDKAGNESNEATERVTYPVTHPPVAVDDLAAGVSGQPATANIIDNDSDPDNDIDPTTINFDPTSVPNAEGKDRDGDGDIDQVTVPGEGVWSVDKAGEATFTPEAGFTGDPTPIKYTIKDKAGNESNPAKITVDYDQIPAIELKKEATLNDGGDGVQAGDTITYTFTVINTGNVPLSNVTITDPKVTVNGGPIAKLEPGQSDSTTFSATYTITADDIKAGKVENQATVTGKDPDGKEVTDNSDDPKDQTNTDPNKDGNPDDPTVTPLPSNPPVAVDDLAAGVSGQPATANIIDNDSDPDNDIDPTTINFDPTSVPNAEGKDRDGDGDIDQVTVPGEGVWSVDKAGEATFTPEAGFTGDPTPIKYTIKDKAGNESNPAKITVDYDQIPAIELKKEATLNDGGDGVQAGDTITYTFTVINTGNVPLSNVTITDPKVTVNGGPIAKLEPGQSDSTTFSATYTITADDIKAGKVENQATVTGKDPDGKEVTDNSDDPKDQTNTDPNKDGNPDDPTVTQLPSTQPPATNPPVTKDDVKENLKPGEAVTIDVVSSDSDPDNDIDPTTVSIIDPKAEDTNGDGYKDKLVVPGEGVWSVDPQSGKITFTPERGFMGNPTPIKYQIRDKQGNLSNEARVIIKYRQEKPDGPTKKVANLTGYYWHDENANGIQDPGELGVVGQKVYLIAPDGTLLESVETDSNGYYTFSNVPLGKDYIVRFTLPNDYLATARAQGGDRSKDSDANSDGFVKIDKFDGSKHIADMGIYCQCDDLEANPQKHKSSGAPAFNIFGLLLTILTFGFIARRGDKEA